MIKREKKNELNEIWLPIIYKEIRTKCGLRDANFLLMVDPLNDANYWNTRWSFLFGIFNCPN